MRLATLATCPRRAASACRAGVCCAPTRKSRYLLRAGASLLQHRATCLSSAPRIATAAPVVGRLPAPRPRTPPQRPLSFIFSFPSFLLSVYFGESATTSSCSARSSSCGGAKV
eukprot:5064974-Pyramimonas_sp.AAC.2